MDTTQAWCSHCQRHKRKVKASRSSEGLRSGQQTVALSNTSLWLETNGSHLLGATICKMQYFLWLTLFTLRLQTQMTSSSDITRKVLHCCISSLQEVCVSFMEFLSIVLWRLSVQSLGILRKKTAASSGLIWDWTHRRPVWNERVLIALFVLHYLFHFDCWPVYYSGLCTENYLRTPAFTLNI